MSKRKEAKTPEIKAEPVTGEVLDGLIAKVRKSRMAQADMRTELAVHVPKALAKIVSLIDSDDPEVSFDASKWVAEMVMGKATQIKKIEDHRVPTTPLQLVEVLKSHGLDDRIPPQLKLLASKPAS